MRNTTLCYIEKDGKYLMLHRVKKKDDLNRGMFIGVGGKFEEGETPEECLLREVKEETGLTLTNYKFRAIVTFVSDRWENEYMHLYSAYDFKGSLKECTEGNLRWVEKDAVEDLPMFLGDKVFLRLIAKKETPYFSLKLCYEGTTLKEAKLDGKALDIEKI